LIVGIEEYIKIGWHIFFYKIPEIVFLYGTVWHAMDRFLLWFYLISCVWFAISMLWDRRLFLPKFWSFFLWMTRPETLFATLGSFRQYFWIFLMILFSRMMQTAENSLGVSLIINTTIEEWLNFNSMPIPRNQLISGRDRTRQTTHIVNSGEIKFNWNIIRFWVGDDQTIFGFNRGRHGIIWGWYGDDPNRIEFRLELFGSGIKNVA